MPILKLDIFTTFYIPIIINDKTIIYLDLLEVFYLSSNIFLSNFSRVFDGLLNERDS
jgi:hypothetical protein